MQVTDRGNNRPPHPPRQREHVGLIRWDHLDEDTWVPETAAGQFVGGDSTHWRIRLYTGIEVDYDLEVWAPYQPLL